jgi:DNA-binding CsgD family transcriptional regulator
MNTPEKKNIPHLSDTDKKMLELLLKGSSGRTIAERLGYKEGTTRVYLHSLYKRIGVNNKTSAVTWYLDTITTDETHAEREAANQAQRIKSFGDMAARRGLLDSLGFMGVFLGPYGRMWEVTQKLKETRTSHLTPSDQQLRATARGLWESLLAGDFSQGKRQFDAGLLPKLFVASPSDAVTVTMMLVLGGYTSSARKAMSSLPAKKAGSLGVTIDELRALTAASDAVEKSNDSAIVAIHDMIHSGSARPVYRHLLLATLFHLYRLRGDTTRASAVADAMWAEAESARAHLEAAGDRSLPPDVALPAPPTVAPAKLSGYLEKLTA